MRIKLHGYKEVYNDYKKVGVLLATPTCNNNCKYCQNEYLKKKKPIEYDISEIFNFVKKNKLIKSFIFGGLDCMDSFDQTYDIIKEIRKKFDYDIVLYTGKLKTDINLEIEKLKNFKGIIIKFGKYKKNKEKKYDELLGITLASNNQYSRRIEDL